MVINLWNWHWIELNYWIWEREREWPSIAGSSSSRASSPAIIVPPRPLIGRRRRASRGRVPSIPIRQWRWRAHAAPPLVVPRWGRRGPVPLVEIGSALSLSLSSSRRSWWWWWWRRGLLVGWLFGGFLLAVTAAVEGFDRHVHDLGHGSWAEPVGETLGRKEGSRKLKERGDEKKRVRIRELWIVA